MHWSEEGRRHKQKNLYDQRGKSDVAKPTKANKHGETGARIGRWPQAPVLKRKKSCYPANKGEAMQAKNTMREKSFKSKQLQKHYHENRAQTTEKKEMQTKKTLDASHSKRVGKWRGQEFTPRRKNERKWRRWYRALRNRIPGSSCVPKNAPKETK